MRLVFGWRVEGLDEVRRTYSRLRLESKAPLLICANHLTMFDSFVIGYALASPGFYLRDFGAVPWNTPAHENFAATWWKRTLVYLMKCVPVKRGGDRKAIGEVLGKIVYLMGLGEVALVFPEGGRSRTGRVDTEAVTYGVGRIVRAQPGCRVLCVYLRGEGQDSWSTRPSRGERFHVHMECFEPKTDQRGMRGTLDINRQVLGRLAALEQGHFEARDGR